MGLRSSLLFNFNAADKSFLPETSVQYYMCIIRTFVRMTVQGGIYPSVSFCVVMNTLSLKGHLLKLENSYFSVFKCLPKRTLDLSDPILFLLRFPKSVQGNNITLFKIAYFSE